MQGQWREGVTLKTWKKGFMDFGPKGGSTSSPAKLELEGRI